MSLCLAPLQILGVQFMVWPRGKCVIFRFGAFSLSQGPPSYCPYYPIIKSWLITGPLHSPAPADKSDTSWRGEKGENFFLSPLIFFLLATFSFKFNIFNSLNLFSCQPGFLFKLFNSLNPFDLSLFWISCPPVWIRNKKAALTFLSCVFSILLLKWLYENMQSHIGCTYLSSGLNFMSSSLN